MDKPTTPVRRVGPDLLRADGWREQVYEDQTGARWECVSDGAAFRWRPLDATELVFGDAVTPRMGAFCGTRFLVLAARAEEGREVLVRPDPPRPGGPAALWVPVGEVAPFFASGRCSVCGDKAHTRCDPAIYMPERGWRVRALSGAWATSPGGVEPILEGTGGTVSAVEDGAIAVDLDSGATINIFGEAAARFLFFWEVL